MVFALCYAWPSTSLVGSERSINRFRDAFWIVSEFLSCIYELSLHDAGDFLVERGSRLWIPVSSSSRRKPADVYARSTADPGLVNRSDKGVEKLKSKLIEMILLLVFFLSF